MRKFSSMLMAALICVLIFCGCEALSIGGAQSGAQASTAESSSTESRAALMRLQVFVMDDLPFLPQKSGLARLLQNAGNGGENRFVNAKIT